MKTKFITFWSPVKRQSGCSTNVALYASYLSHVMDETEKAVVYSINENIDAADYLTSATIRNGGKDLLLLSETNNVSCKEDVLAYTHKLSENIDILGTGKEREIADRRKILMLEILSKAYDYIIIDSVTDGDSGSDRIIGISDIIIVCMPQDRFVYEQIDLSRFENKKIIFLSTLHNEKNDLNLNKIQALVPAQAYKIGRYEKVNQAVYEQEVFSFVTDQIKRKSSLINELSELHSEIYRLINIERLKITYEIKNGNIKSREAMDSTDMPEQDIKVIKEYKFIKTKNNIAIINLTEGAGSTFLGINLAYLLKERKVNVSVVEMPTINAKNDILHILTEDFESFKNKNVITKNGIKFHINNFAELGDLSKDDIIEYISLISKNNNVNLYDVGSKEFDENISFLTNVIDVAIIVIDPMPYKLLQAEEKIKLIKGLKDKNINLIYILNKYIKDLNKKDIERYLGISISACIPFVDPETIYAAYYSNQAVYQIEKSASFHNSLQDIVSAADVIKYENHTNKKKFKLFKWRYM